MREVHTSVDKEQTNPSCTFSTWVYARVFSKRNPFLLSKQCFQLNKGIAVGVNWFIMDPITSMTPTRQIVTPRICLSRSRGQTSILHAPSRNMEGESRHRITPQRVGSNARRVLKFPILSDDNGSGFSLKRKRQGDQTERQRAVETDADIEPDTEAEAEEDALNSSRGNFRPITPTNPFARDI